MRYPQEITLEVRNEEPDKKRRFTPRSLFKHPLRSPLPVCRPRQAHSIAFEVRNESQDRR